MGVGQHHVPVAPDQVHGVAGLADHHPADGELHGSIGLDAVSLRMTPHDFNPRNHRRAFVFPHRGLYRARSGRPAVAAGEPECRAGALHQQGGGAVSADAGNAGLCQIKFEGFGEPVGTLWEVEVSRAGADRLLEDCGVVVESIPGGAEGAHIGLGVAAAGEEEKQQQGGGLHKGELHAA
jgi:hypothetical protein